jgi:hypothetical protein
MKLKKLMKLKNTTKLRKKLRGNRGSLRSHWGHLRNCMKFEEAYEIEPMLPKTSLRKSLTTF